MKMFRDGINGLVLACVVLTILSFNLITFQGQPLWMVFRNIILAGLGEPTPGLTIRGDNKPPVVNCDYETGVCEVER